MRYLITFLLFLPYFTFSQTTDSEPEQKKVCIGFVPQYAISNGIRIDLDYRIKENNQWLVVSPQFFISNGGNFGWEYTSMAGAGLMVQHKIFLKNIPLPKGFYFAYGSLFKYFSVKDDGYTARAYKENGGNYIGLIEDEMTTNIYKIGGNTILGVQLLFSNQFYIDIYTGTGIRFSFDNHTTGLHGYYNDWWGDMGYSGTLLIGGVRFGVTF